MMKEKEKKKTLRRFFKINAPTVPPPNPPTPNKANNINKVFGGRMDPKGENIFCTFF
jgi:hypothetical protein